MRTVYTLTLLIALFTPVSSHGGDARIWTDRTGRRAEAEYLGFAHGKVQVRRTTDGKLFEVPLETFSDADQSFVRAQERTDRLRSDATLEARVDQDSIPQEISVEEALKWLKGAEPRGQGDGLAIWKGESWSYYASHYDSIIVPWSKTPVEVMAGFTYGKERGVHHLIAFSGPNFRFRRTDDSPTLKRKDTKK
ncbi:MAG: SHD1 domain-containing protein [Pirellulales bacterium]